MSGLDLVVCRFTTFRGNAEHCSLTQFVDSGEQLVRVIFEYSFDPVERCVVIQNCASLEDLECFGSKA